MKPSNHISLERPQPWSRPPRLALAWLSSCLYCHSSFQDLDECLDSLVGIADVVFRPAMAGEEFPEDVDLTLVEGGIATDRDLELAEQIRVRSWKVVAFGDCAIVGAKLSICGPKCLAESLAVRVETPDGSSYVAAGTDRASPLHHAIHTDYSLPGCPPSLEQTIHAIGALLSGRSPSLTESTKSA